MKEIAILSVGHCHYDGPRIAALLKKELGATVDQASTLASAIDAASKTKYDLILVNRILDETGEAGLDLVKTVVARGLGKVMLVSNYADAQQSAQEHGAVAGFGKDQLGTGAVAEVVRAALDG